jgi:hypothetical protein
MPEILVTTTEAEGDEEAVVHRERVSLSDFESDHFCGQLVERVGWAVLDADQAEHGEPPGAQPRFRATDS